MGTPKHSMVMSVTPELLKHSFKQFENPNKKHDINTGQLSTLQFTHLKSKKILNNSFTFKFI